MSTMDGIILELFQEEVGSQSAALIDGLLSLEKETGGGDAILEALLRASHALKGAARLAMVPGAERLSHILEDCFVLAQKGSLELSSKRVDVLLRAVDLIGRLAAVPGQTTPELDAEVDQTVAEVREVIEEGFRAKTEAPSERPWPAPPPPPPPEVAILAGPEVDEVEGEALSEDLPPGDEADGGAHPPKALTDASAAPSSSAPMQRRPVRVSAERLDTILGLTGELEIAIRWTREALETLGRQMAGWRGVEGSLQEVREALAAGMPAETTAGRLDAAWGALRRGLTDMDTRLQALGVQEMRMSQLTSDLKEAVLKSRMRPFRDITTGLPRMVRQLSRDLGKQATLEVHGQDTLIDRDILEQIEGPLTQLLRNSMDHGLEHPDDRVAAGKAPEGHIKVSAETRAGALKVTVEDDGRGVDLASLRRKIVARKLAPPEVVEVLSEPELLDFLFLPAFSTRDEVTTISGRGVGLDLVASALKTVRGTVGVVNKPGRGLRFELTLPVGLAVMRALLVDIADELYALPLARVVSALCVEPSQIYVTHGRPHVEWEGKQLSLASAADVLGLPSRPIAGERLDVVVLGSEQQPVGLVVGAFEGQRELAVRRLDPRLGKVQGVSSAALLDDGTPTLILDIDDLVSAMTAGTDVRVVPAPRLPAPEEPRRPRVLVVEDSATVRALEARLLEQEGFEVMAAVDGMEGWALLNQRRFDLLVTDIDMPRMDGLELLAKVRANPKLDALPVVIVSYKDQPAYRARGLELGADRYLTKASFEDHAFVEACWTVLESD